MGAASGEGGQARPSASHAGHPAAPGLAELLRRKLTLIWRAVLSSRWLSW